jgi:hypothetical protein
VQEENRKTITLWIEMTSKVQNGIRNAARVPVSGEQNVSYLAR